MCAVTGCNILAVLEAAHIKAYRGENDNNAGNGLLLRADIHTLFDLNLLGIEPGSLKVELHPKIAQNKEYYSLSGKTLLCQNGNKPSRIALELRYKEFRKLLYRIV